MKLSTKYPSVLSVVVLMIWGSCTKAQDNVRAGSEPIVTSIDPSKLTYDYLVDGNLTQDDPANKKFKTLQAAYAAAPEGTEAKPTIIGIMPNVYQIPGSMEPGPSMSITKNWITFLGLTNNRRSVVLADNRGLDEGADDDGYLLDVNATGFTVRNLTILNYCNCDYEYPGDPAKNLKMRNPTITQAVALQASGDKHVYENVAILGRLDTMFLRTARSYFKNVYIEGTDDWMGGGQISVWQDCELVYPTGRGVMSASGVVFFNCKFEATRGMQFYKVEFGSAARPDALINCVVPVTSPRAPVAWVRGKAAPRPSQYSLTYQNKDADGNPAVIYDDSVSAPTFTYSREFSEQELQAYNPWNLLRAAPNAPADDWDPAGVREKYESTGQGPLVFRMALTMGSPSNRGSRFGAGASPAPAPRIRTGGPGVTIGATVTPKDAANKTITWSTKSDLISLSRTTGPNIVVTGRNTTEDAQYAAITAKASNGFYVTAYVYVEPKFVDPPAVTVAPKLSAPADGKVGVDYTLDLGGREDQSLITWSTCDDASGANPKKVAVSRGNQPLKAYTLMPGDIGKYLRASVEPKHQVSEPGPAVYAMAATAIASSDIPSSTVSPNFRNFVEAPTSAPVSGLWAVQGDWTIVAGDNLTNGYGIRAGRAGGPRLAGSFGLQTPATLPTSGAARGGTGSGGSSLLYFKDGDSGDMQVDLVMTPDKTEGTVFAVPGAPTDTGTRNGHGDIYIKYDPRTGNGYSLRYWRTTRSAAACMYQFYKIEDGVGSPLNTEQLLSGVFKQNTFLTLKVTGSTISMTAHNTVDDQTLNMEGTITPNHFGGAGVWSTGAATTYSLIKISYP
jgi:Pectinesterase